MSTISWNKCAIALVEDYASFRRAVERLLSASGFEVHAFSSAEEFLRSTSRDSYACLILDIQLPGMSGIDLRDHLNGLASARPVIFITAQDDGSLRERASQFPHSAYLCKPFVGTALLETVHSLIKHSGSGAENTGI